MTGQPGEFWPLGISGSFIGVWNGTWKSDLGCDSFMSISRGYGLDLGEIWDDLGRNLAKTGMFVGERAVKDLEGGGMEPS